MKKFLYLLPLFMLFLPIHCYAVSSATLDTIVHGLAGLETNGFSGYGIAPLLPLLEDDPYESYNSVLTSQTGVSSLGLSMSDITEVIYDETLKNDFADYTFHDKDGNTLQWSDIKLYEFENAFYHGYFFTDSNGDIIYDSSDNTLINFNYGGSVYSAEDINGIYNNIVDVLNDSNLIYDPSGTQLDNKSFYIFNGVWDRGVIGAQYLYIPNVYQRGVCVISPNNSPSASGIDFYSNDSSLFHHVVTYDPYNNIRDYPQYYNYWSLESGSFNVDGYIYKYHGRYSYRVYDYSETFPYENWLNGTASAEQGLFTYSPGVFPIPSKFIGSSDLTTFIGVSVSDTLSLNDTYSYDDIFDYADVIADSVGVPVGTFDPSGDITTDNLPVVYPISIDVPISVIPFPDVKEGTDDPAIPVDPSLDHSPDLTIDPENIGNSIPLLSNLKNRFPFSIPWDIYNLYSGLAVQRETPYINASIFIPGVNYTWVLDYDLHAFDDVASLFRTLFLISYIIGLAWFSYDHFFGS